MDLFSSQRKIILWSWLISLSAALVGTVSYEWVKTKEGIVYLSHEDVVGILKPLAVLYGSHLGAILVAAFTKPVKIQSNKSMFNYLFEPALVWTVLFNLIVLFFVFHGYFQPDGSIIKDFEDMKNVAGSFSFLVAPVNFLYFGVQQKV